jgi:predicted dehydrogenase
MHKGNLSRRGFLARATAALTAGAGLPAWYAREVLAAEQADEARKGGPNDRLTFGIIGSGDRSKQLVNDLKRHQGWQIVAVCDVDMGHRDEVAKLVGGDVTKYHDFRELCARKDIDAVLIVTPDHWHTLPAIAAMKAGKHVYCEKPLTLTVAEGQALVKVAKATDRTFQVGSQQRSDARFRLACELVRNGRLGKLKTVETRIGGNPKAGPLPVVPVPEGLDWDFWLGQTPKVPFVMDTQSKDRHPPSRCHYQFRWWYEYSGGKMTDWGAHHNDIAQWALGADGSGPVAVQGSGTTPSSDPHSYNCHPDFTATYTYPNGVQLVCKSQGDNGVRFEGEDGKWIFVSRGKIDASDKQLLEEKLPDSAARLYVSTNHMGNFLECVKTRKPTVCTAEVGHRSVSVCHIGNIAIRTGKKLKWDPVKEQFDDAEANKMLSRPMRDPWRLEA